MKDSVLILPMLALAGCAGPEQGSRCVAVAGTYELDDLQLAEQEPAGCTAAEFGTASAPPYTLAILPGHYDCDAQYVTGLEADVPCGELDVGEGCRLSCMIVFEVGDDGVPVSAQFHIALWCDSHDPPHLPVCAHWYDATIAPR